MTKRPDMALQRTRRPPFRGNSRVLFALRSLGADVDRLPEIPDELADYIADLTLEDLERIRGDVEELERLGLVSKHPLNVRPKEGG